MMVGMKKLLLLPILALFSCQSPPVMQPEVGGSCEVPQPSRIYGNGVSVAKRPGWVRWDRTEISDLSLVNDVSVCALIVKHDRDPVCPTHSEFTRSFEADGFRVSKIETNGSMTEIVAVRDLSPIQVKTQFYCVLPYTRSAMCASIREVEESVSECQVMLDSIRFE